MINKKGSTLGTASGRKH